MSTTSHVTRLREKLAERKIDAYIIPSADAHQSEYVAECDKRRAFISNFTGSAGTALVTTDKALLWTDGRYFLQAEQELSSEWTLMRQGEKDVPSVEDWLQKSLSRGARIGFDPWLIPVSQHKRLEALTKGSQSLELAPTDENLVDLVWGESRPVRPQEKVLVLPLTLTGESTLEKVDKIRTKLASDGACALVVTALDEVAWLFNLRGGDIPFNPVFFANAIVTDKDTRLYINPAKLGSDAQTHLSESKVTVQPYEAFLADLLSIKAEAAAKEAQGSSCFKVLVDPGKSPAAILTQLPASLVLEKESPIGLMKAVKNQTELDGVRRAHIRDALAVCRFMAWLDQTVENDRKAGRPVSVDELKASDKLESFRREAKLPSDPSAQPFVQPSFETIAGAGPNGAVIHYRAVEATNRPIDGMFLLDSGAQYLDGTTDITRTVHVAEPSAFEKLAYTRVLQGHIALASAVFPQGTVGPKLDVLARMFLWREGLEYLHGTGHGVGAFLNVHEGPHGISSSVAKGSVSETPLQPGMLVTNEPGYYHNGSFGIRIENVMVVVPTHTNHRFNGKDYYTFETISLVPIQTKLIDTSLLSSDEAEWINEYHATVLEQVGSYLSGADLEWLHSACAPLPLSDTLPLPSFRLRPSLIPQTPSAGGGYKAPAPTPAATPAGAGTPGIRGFTFSLPTTPSSTLRSSVPVARGHRLGGIQEGDVITIDPVLQQLAGSPIKRQ